MRIWVDLTNSPHVLVFRPLVRRLERAGHSVEVTARNYAQTVGLCRRFGMSHMVVGRHRGGRSVSKFYGLLSRSRALHSWARGRGFQLALSHGSTELPVVARALRIPSVTMFDYEFATVQHFLNCRLATRVVVPDAIPPERLYRYGARGKLSQYPGLKEEYYLTDFEPSPQVIDELGLDKDRVIVVVRTPPDVSLYHRFRNEIFGNLIRALKEKPVQAVVLPRTEEQLCEIRAIEAPNFVVPDHVIDTQSLIAQADVVVGAGGTMNRESVALGTQAYTTFAGRMGAVDEALLRSGRLKRLRDPDDLVLEKKPANRQRTRRDPQQMIDLLL